MKIDLDRIAQSEHRRVDIDLHRARLPVLGQKLRPGKTGADQQQCIAIAHHVGRGLGAEQPDRAGDERQIVGQHVLAEQGLGDPGADAVGDLDHLAGGAARAGADQDRDLFAGVEDVGGALQVGRLRHDRRSGIARPGAGEAMLLPRFLIGRILHVLRQDDRAHLVARDRDADRAIGHVARLRRGGDFLDIARDVGEQPVEVEFLLIARTAHGRLRLSGDREHRHVIEPRVVEPGDEMRRARPAGRKADAEFAGEFGMRRGHECGHLFVPHLDEFDSGAVLLRPLERAEHAVDAVAGIAVDSADAPAFEPLDEKVAGHPRHIRSSAFRVARRARRAALSSVRTNRRARLSPPRGDLRRASASRGRSDGAEKPAPSLLR